MSIGENDLEVVKSIKLLGVMFTSDLKWNEHTAYITKKARKRLWFLRRLSKLGASQHTLIDVYDKMIRTLLEVRIILFLRVHCQKLILMILKIFKGLL